MALSIDYTTKVISIPKADLTLIQTVPTEIRELDLGAFHDELRDWEDNEDNIYMPVTHDYAAPADIGGVTLAYVVLLINGYTVTFEDGQYAVNIIGGNSNVGDNINVNQVSVRSFNSAGLVQNAEIQFASYEGFVWYDSASTNVGTEFPIGTRTAPVNNMADAQLIMQNVGLGSVMLLSPITLATDDYSEIRFVGESPLHVFVDVQPSATVTGCRFENLTLTGTMDVDTIIEKCIINGLSAMRGIIYESMINSGTIVLGGAGTTHLLNCWSGVPGTGTPTIDLGGSGQSLALRGFAGGMTLENKTGPESVSIDMLSGQVILADTVTTGTIVMRGLATWTNQDTYLGGANVLDQFIDYQEVPTSIDYSAIWDEPMTSGNTAEQELLLARSEASSAHNRADDSATDAELARISAQLNTTKLDEVIADIAALEAPDNTAIQAIYQAHFHRRRWDKVGNTITIYEADDVTPLFVFNTDAELADITPV